MKNPDDDYKWELAYDNIEKAIHILKYRRKIGKYTKKEILIMAKKFDGGDRDDKLVDAILSLPISNNDLQ